MDAQPIQSTGSKSLVPSRCPLITKTAETAIASVERAIAYRFPPNWWAIYPVRATAAVPASAGIRRSTNERRSQKLGEQPGDGRNQRRHVYIAPRHVPAAGVVVKLVAKDAITIRREQVQKQAQALRSPPQSQWGWHTSARNFGAFENPGVSENSFWPLRFPRTSQQIIRKWRWRSSLAPDYLHPVLAHSSLCLRLMGTEYQPSEPRD